MDRLCFVQSERWQRSEERGTESVYRDDRCCYCWRKTRPDAARLRTARTNDGEWWLVGPAVDMTAPEWKDFQWQMDGSFASTPLPIGPDCLRQHPEWRFALVTDDPEPPTLPRRTP